MPLESLMSPVQACLMRIWMEFLNLEPVKTPAQELAASWDALYLCYLGCAMALRNATVMWDDFAVAICLDTK